MPLVNMKPLLRDAMDNGYAVAAFNLVDYGTTKAMVQAAEELNAPVICQTSTKTIQYWSHKEIVSWVRTVAEDSPVPVVLHLDHCHDIGMIEECAKAGWTSIMIDASELPFEENLAQSLKVREIAELHRAAASLRQHMPDTRGTRPPGSVASWASLQGQGMPWRSGETERSMRGGATTSANATSRRPTAASWPSRGARSTAWG